MLQTWKLTETNVSRNGEKNMDEDDFTRMVEIAHLISEQAKISHAKGQTKAVKDILKLGRTIGNLINKQLRGEYDK